MQEIFKEHTFVLPAEIKNKLEVHYLEDRTIEIQEYLDPTYLGELVSMVRNGKPHYLLLKGFPVSSTQVPEQLKIKLSGKKEFGEYISEQLKIYLEKVLTKRISSETGNVVRVFDGTQLEREPVHTHMHALVNNLFCLVPDPEEIQVVVFIHEVVDNLSKEAITYLSECGLLAYKNAQIIIGPALAEQDDCIGYLRSRANESSYILELAYALESNKKSYLLDSGDLLFFSQSTTMRGAGDLFHKQKRWNQSSIYFY